MWTACVVSKQMHFLHFQNGATLSFIWSRITGQLMNASPILTLFLALFCSSLMCVHVFVTVDVYVLLCLMIPGFICISPQSAYLYFFVFFLISVLLSSLMLT